jgi:biopolymer transport protein ExbD
VRAHIEQLKAVDPKAGIVIIADERAPTGAVVAVADQIRLAGISDITFTTTPLAKPQ